MTVATPITDRPAGIACGCVSGDRLILVRTDRSLEIVNLTTDTPELKSGVPFNIVALTSVSLGKIFASIDSSFVIRIHSVHDGSLVTERVIEPYFRHPEVSPGTSSQWGNFQFIFLPSWGSLIYRSERVDLDMSLDHHRRRVLGDIFVVDMDSGDRKPLFTPLAGEVPISFARLPQERIAVLSRMHSHYKIRKFSQTASHAVAIPPPTVGKLGDELIGIEFFEDRLLVVGTAGIGVFDVDFDTTAVRLISVAPIATAMVSRKMGNCLPPTSPISPRSPRINPALNVYRKHSTVQVPPSIGDAIVGLSLGTNESQLEASGEHSVSLPRELWRYMRIGDFIVVFSHGMAHLVDLKIGFSRPIENMNFFCAYTGEGKICVLVSASQYVVVDSDNPFSAFESGVCLQPQPAVAMAALDENLLLTLRAQQMDFTFLKSVEARSVFDFSHFPFFNLFANFFDNENILLVSTVGHTAVIRVVESSPMAAISLESGFTSKQEDRLQKTAFSAIDVSHEWSDKISLEFFTVGLYVLDGAVFQITEKRVLKNRVPVISLPSELDAIVVGHCSLAGEAIFILLSTGDLWEIRRDGILSTVQTNVADATCVNCDSEGQIFLGTFDGCIVPLDPTTSLAGPPQKISEASIDCLEVSEEFIIVTARASQLMVFLKNDEMRPPHIFDLDNIIKLSRLDDRFFLVSGYDGMHVLDTVDVSLFSVALGHTGSVGTVGVGTHGSVLVPLLDSNRLVHFNLNLKSKNAVYSKPLPFVAAGMTLSHEGTAYIVGWLNKMQQAALVVLSLDKSRIGLIGTNDAVSVSSVFPFDTLKEEPVSIALWNQAMFPDGGLLAVGTRGKARGRLVLFERRGMNAVAKTSVPSISVSCIAEMSASLLVIGCEDSVAVLSLKPGPRSMPALLTTVAVFHTYSLVKSLTVVDGTRFLAVADNGHVQLLSLNLSNNSLVCDATLESPFRVQSQCYIVPWAKQFACTSDDGDLRLYTFDAPSPQDVGLMRLVSTNRIGSTITAGCARGQKLVLSLSNGTTLELTKGWTQIQAST